MTGDTNWRLARESSSAGFDPKPQTAALICFLLWDIDRELCLPATGALARMPLRLRDERRQAWAASVFMMKRS